MGHKNKVAFKSRAMRPQQAKPIIDRMAADHFAKEKARIEQEAIMGIIAVFVTNLHDKHGWGKTRINKLIHESTVTFFDMENKLVCIDDFKEWCRTAGIEGLGF